ncbi:hypothetical protein [Vibrio parahaemolyticus]|uniref:hypothetical protein n=1 Tax=Vibrio parahaemolyticus TaxID=670 RepID=UPI001E55D66A|nr:hypothetical protein [Vibrio parahaemolyticus]MEA5281442.1 hypothetical protein [Vibrio parahaemolyticus]
MNNFKNKNEALIHLCGHAVNKLISEKLDTLNLATDAHETGHIECELQGRRTLINWHNINGQEIRVGLWWDFDKTKHPQHLEGGKRHLIVVDDYPENYKLMNWKESSKWHREHIFRDSNTIERYETAEPLASKGRYHQFVGLVVQFWVEIERGKYIQTDTQNRGKPFGTLYMRQGTDKKIRQIEKCIPNGFSLEGPFHM